MSCENNTEIRFIEFLSSSHYVAFYTFLRSLDTFNLQQKLKSEIVFIFL